MQRVLVIDSNQQPLMPCRPARARKLLKAGKAAVFRRYPFTIVLKYPVEANNQDVQTKVDPGSKATGLVLVGNFKRGKKVMWSAEIHHRGDQIRESLFKRRILRRSRRSRTTRHRISRFNNRKNYKSRLSPSLQSRVDNILNWLTRLSKFVPVTHLSMELVRFDTQLMQNPEISGVEYRQGELYGYEVKEYLLEKWGRRCAYCHRENLPLQVEHIIPKSRGGSSRVSNLTLSCEDCNRKKGNRTAAEFGHAGVQAQAKRPLKDVAIANGTRWFIHDSLKASGLPLEVGTGGLTRYNRHIQNYPKTHWIDAACVGESGAKVYLPAGMKPLQIRAAGRGTRQMCQMNKFGFPRTRPKPRIKRFYGFQTGDMVKAIVTKGKYKGVYIGRVAVRSIGRFRVGKNDSVGWQSCRILHYADGYEYSFKENTKGAIVINDTP